MVMPQATAYGHAGNGRDGVLTTRLCGVCCCLAVLSVCLADDSVLNNKSFMIILLMVLWLVFSFCCGSHQTNRGNHLWGQLSTAHL